MTAEVSDFFLSWPGESVNAVLDLQNRQSPFALWNDGVSKACGSRSRPTRVRVLGARPLLIHQLESILNDNSYRGCRNMFHKSVEIYRILNSYIKNYLDLYPNEEHQAYLGHASHDGGSVRAVGPDHVAVLGQNGTRLDPSWVKQQWHMPG